MGRSVIQGAQRSQLVHLVVGYTPDRRAQEPDHRNSVVGILQRTQNVDQIDDLLAPVEVLLAVRHVRNAVPVKRLKILFRMGQRPEEQGHMPGPDGRLHLGGREGLVSRKQLLEPAGQRVGLGPRRRRGVEFLLPRSRRHQPQLDTGSRVTRRSIGSRFQSNVLGLHVLPLAEQAVEDGVDDLQHDAVSAKIRDQVVHQAAGRPDLLYDAIERLDVRTPKCINGLLRIADDE